MISMLSVGYTVDVCLQTSNLSAFDDVDSLLFVLVCKAREVSVPSDGDTGRISTFGDRYVDYTIHGFSLSI